MIKKNKNTKKLNEFDKDITEDKNLKEVESSYPVEPEDYNDDINKLYRKITKFEIMASKFNASNIVEFIDIYKNPKKLYRRMFFVGIAKGFGTAIGLTVVTALVFYIVTKLVDLPVIGNFVSDLINFVKANQPNINGSGR